jgi:acetyl-CoA carboxylase biotin carboxyl carrier protein
MARPRRRPDGAPEDVVDLVRRLAALLAELGLSELEVTRGDVRIRLGRPGAPPGPTAAPVLAAPGTLPAEPLVVADVTAAALVTIESPMVGTFYRAPSPNAEPYVREGDPVKEGQVLCIVEAMKLMNEIESKTAGRIVKVLVDNGHAVEYGQPLFLIEPAR